MNGKIWFLQLLCLFGNHVTAVFEYLAEPLFAFYLEKQASPSGGITEPPDDGGVLMLGGVDPQYYTGEIHYVPVIRRAYWQFDMASVSLGDKVLVQKTTAIADTGTSLLIGPTEQVIDHLGQSFAGQV